MSAAKKKVQFSDKRRVKKFKQPDSDHSGDDEFDDGDNEKDKKHTLDSDEEDNQNEYERLNPNALKDIGQEAKTSEFDAEIKLTPFNMKDELDEGEFDKDGYYHWKKDKDEVKDAWLDNIDWANINSFKDSDRLTKDPTKVVKDDNENENDDNDDDDEYEEELGEEITKEENESEKQIDMFKKILEYLKPRETVTKALNRLGGSSQSMSASQRWAKKKPQSAAATSSKTGGDKEAVEKLTGYCNYFIDRGYYDVYQETYESLEDKIARVANQDGSSSGSTSAAAAASFDIFADEVDEKELTTSNTNPGTSSSQPLEDAVVKWEYKLTNSDEDKKIFGPFTSAQMLDKNDKGEFKETGVWCRRIGEESTQFYNSKRIDFDLYT